jgi:xylulokinase
MYLGIDLGTSEVKALLLDDRHGIVAQAGSGLSLSRPQPLWSEQEPADWWHATDQALARLRAAAPEALAAVRAIGLSGQMHGAVLLDAGDTVLRPAILWNDGRSANACTALERAIPRLSDITGNVAMPGFTAPKLWWVREHEPRVFDRVACVLLPKDWLRLQLSGERITDCSDASGTLWLDVAARAWSSEVLEACGLSVSQMPALVEGSEVAGRLRPEIAQRWGMKAGIPIAGGGGDNAASAIGIGAIDAGQGFVSLGTSGVLFVAGERFLPHPESGMHAFCHALPARWHQMSVMLSAASCVGWAGKLLGRPDVAVLLAEAGALDEAQRERAPIFLPYLSGERTPHRNPHAQGVLFGLTHDHDGAALAYAVCEGVGFGLLDGLHALRLPADIALGSLSLVGGGARSAWWAQLLASTIDVPLTLHQSAEAGAALGAARLGWLADGGVPDLVCTLPAVVRRFEPEPAEHERLMRRYDRFRRLYPALLSRFTDA